MIQCIIQYYCLANNIDVKLQLLVMIEIRSQTLKNLVVWRVRRVWFNLSRKHSKTVVGDEFATEFPYYRYTGFL